ncbi:NAD(P)/FAD-dependent oxidoreductase [Primorskyibacter marinus]|uniref:NAD(P)/FAD-dependent oxidoreductase n=1 Tax=Primorskyibacter marinus TaxID=1977320 RepID=UPI000E2FFD4D|nr:NAD(P)/FAD-dependent oxidoreductase [Primorskyibacter marinus]
MSHAPFEKTHAGASAPEAPVTNRPVGQSGAKPRVVIIGAGFGGLAAAKSLGKTDAEVILIDRSNHHLFQPLLYQVATAALSPADIASATRAMFSRTSNVSVVMDEVTGIDAGQRQVTARKSGGISYDYLILATGAEYSFFGNNAWAEHAPVLKSIDDALNIRRGLLAAFEKAECSEDPQEIRRLLTFALVGGGPTGIEMAGAIAELARTVLSGNFRRINEEDVRIILVEAGQNLLSACHDTLSQAALKALRDHGVEVILGKAVAHIDANGLAVGDEIIPSANVIWCAGTQARPAGEWLGAETARNKAVIVGPDCTVPDYPEIFAIGDVASYTDKDGNTLPGLAPVAKQQGRYVAKVIAARIKGRAAPSAFRYQNWGTMAVIGRAKAVADFGWLRLSGFPAWLAWSLVHLMLLVDFRSRGSVYLNWTWAWFTRGRAARILTRPETLTRNSPPNQAATLNT